MNRLLFLFIIPFACSCASLKPTGTPFEVKYNGALRNMMHEGDISAKVDLNDFRNTKHFYALGALENLKGEILILDSKPMITSVQNDQLSFSHSFDQRATLLVYASVKKWSSFNVPDQVKSYTELEAFIEQTAIAHGINPEEPFPFLITGMAKSFDWHVIDWPEGDTEHTHEKHIQSGLHGRISNQAVEILGFYSRHHHAIFTHHSTNMHMHFKTSDNTLAGHVDDLVGGQSLTLRLPFLPL